VRAYSYRHGAGPLVTEDEKLKQALPPETHNVTNAWQGNTRVGWFDLLSTRYGVEINSRIDCLALTMLDKLALLGHFKVCISYEYKRDSTDVSLLNTYFDWEYDDHQRIRITRLKPVKNQQSDQFARVLFDCRPFEFIEFNGMPADISRAKSLKDFPGHILEFIRFLESNQGLGRPIRICSVGPTVNDKILTG
jgi:adenylosuccinate synthase